MSEPRVGDSVWLEGRKNRQGGPNSNGVISRILYEDGQPYEAVLRFDGDVDIIDYELICTFNERLNQWLVYNGTV